MTDTPAETPLEHAEHADAAHVCANCETALVGRYCHACGQHAHLHHRLRDLLHELVEGIAHFDGRLWRTLPVLALNPGRLSREWREGKRQRYVSPLHLFLFATFLLFVIPSFTGRHLVNVPNAQQIEMNVMRNGVSERQTVGAGVAGGHSPADHARLTGAERWGHMMGHKLRHVAENNQYYSYKIEGLAYKLSFLIVPISMLILGLLLVFKRGFTFYDHGVVALYGIGFGTLLLAFASLFVGWPYVALRSLMLVVIPVHAV
ncbi:MAG TPA: DUF3667 domain-containing protein, partial [Caulobacteraceae bacterium]